ncbi:OmpA family protein [Sideroxydans lithotrophicus]|uniref:OmpA/MotB domain protein n=1 Tax=Sideroxydans lithotrophicus (strain ES-1) TaxID=580332 RepID=D5CQE9_SIDLE|nr:OmpA family protein [Sideroxydans lithotrophicus]ADE13170.1 OmpA/MotB domain protein [Sideroxydans lithotrophicus ES-1]
MDAFSAWFVTVYLFYLLSDKPAGAPLSDIRETVVLLPDTEVKNSGVVILSGGKEFVVNQSLHGVELEGGNAEQKTYTPDEIQKLYPDVMQTLPKRPRSFTLRFEEDGAKLTAESINMIADIRQEITRRAAPEVVVTGHASRAGMDETNLSLSMQRAKVVRDVLVAGGVPAQIIQVVGRGEFDPAATTQDGVAGPPSRRVEITVR